MGDTGDDFNAYKKDRQEKKARNRDNGAKRLEVEGVTFEDRNFGAHLIVRHAGVVIDYWPGTGLWIVRGKTGRNRGVQSLLNYLKGEQ